MPCFVPGLISHSYNMTKSDYDKLIDGRQKPELLKYGFKEVFLKECIYPELPDSEGNLWFGSSRDWRDRYLEINSGKLFVHDDE